MSAGTKIRAVRDIVLHRRERQFYLQRLVMSPDARATRANQLAQRLPQGSEGLSDRQTRMVEDYQHQGYVLLPSHLQPAIAASMRDHLKKTMVRDIHRPNLGEFDPLVPASRETNVAYHKDLDVLQMPGVFDLANDPLILGAVTKILGARPLISYMAAWWTYPSLGDQLKRGEMFHRDVDDWRFVKVFTYLTDVDDEAGPHQFIARSQCSEELTVTRNFQDDEVFPLFDRQDLRSFVGAAGTSLMENTFGLHRGTKPVHRPRLIYQTLYSLRPTIYGPRRPVMDASDVAGNAPLDAYVNSIYLRF